MRGPWALYVVLKPQAAMFNAIKNTYRLAKAGFTLAWYGVGFVPNSISLPGPLRVLRGADDGAGAAAKRKANRLSRALGALGPSYIKLGQFLSTRPDVVGPQLAALWGRCATGCRLSQRKKPNRKSRPRSISRGPRSTPGSALPSPRPPSRRCIRRPCRRMAPPTPSR